MINRFFNNDNINALRRFGMGAKKVAEEGLNACYRILHDSAPNITNNIGMTLELLINIIELLTNIIGMTLAIPRILTRDPRIIPYVVARLMRQPMENDQNDLPTVAPT